jgi:ABC-type branched-subunit amino acid transport system substrate-binding protein
MRERSRWVRTIALVAVLALGLTACPDDDNGNGVADGEDVDDPGDVQFDVGVSEEPCPDAVNDDNGCIYLGTLSDLTTGPFAAFGPEIVAGQQAFWDRVNEEGGIGGLFDVHISDHIEDTEYLADQHVQSYQQIVGDIAAITQTLGTHTTNAIADDMDADNVVGAVLTWWSGWEFEDYDVVLQSGSNYCLDAMNGVEWAQEEHDVDSIMVVYFDNDYGFDVASGVESAAEELGIEFMGGVEISAVERELSGAIESVLGNEPDIVHLALGPAEVSDLIADVVPQGYEGRFITSHPGFFAALAGNEVIVDLLNIVAPHENFGGDSEAHDAMRESLDGEEPGNDGFTFGWIAAYPIQSALELAVENGDLTREGIRQAALDMTVDYEGALPDKQYGGEPDETVQRVTTIAQPNPEAVQGLETIEQRFEGSVAGEYDFSAPCFDPFG